MRPNECGLMYLRLHSPGNTCPLSMINQCRWKWRRLAGCFRSLKLFRWCGRGRGFQFSKKECSIVRTTMCRVSGNTVLACFSSLILFVENTCIFAGLLPFKQILRYRRWLSPEWNLTHYFDRVILSDRGKSFSAEKVSEFYKTKHI